jgi:hypothetical protein
MISAKESERAARFDWAMIVSPMPEIGSRIVAAYSPVGQG